ncbi:hypothetical protein LY78DRAFT_85571 [Colletotrichum sublineola]|nr:hypothetical protein LY78DRAFT_85571 [Colletotrichum sublineola]
MHLYYVHSTLLSVVAAAAAAASLYTFLSAMGIRRDVRISSVHTMARLPCERGAGLTPVVRQGYLMDWPSRVVKQSTLPARIDTWVGT